ncbi:MAG: XdhC family protein [Ardenticatenales bacterium]|nr:XdhC family protein [Ardenticatenales bacterium]
MNDAPPPLPILKSLMDAVAAGEGVVLATIVQEQGSVPRHAGSKMLIYSDGRTLGSVGGGEMEALVIATALPLLASAETRLITYNLVEPGRGDPGVCGGQVRIYLEPYNPPATLLILGAGHVGRALAHLGHWLGYRVAVYDDRAELVTAANIPNAHVYLSGDIDEALARFPITPHTYIAAVTRNVLVDRVILPQLLPTPAPYIGVIGSRRRWAETVRLLREDGLDEDGLTRFHSPVGLELNAETPEEIALSIMAEITMLRRGGDGNRMMVGKTTLA